MVAGLAIILAWGIDGAAAVLTGKPPSTLKLISLVVTIICTGIVAIANAVWRRLWKRFPSIGRKLFPVLTGPWAGTLESTWKNPETGQGVASIAVTLGIRQGLFST